MQSRLVGLLLSLLTFAPLGHASADPVNKPMLRSMEAVKWKRFVPVAANVGGHEVSLAAILLPVTADISNRAVRGWMQLDSGANTSILYGGALRRVLGKHFAITEDRWHQTGLRGETAGYPFSLHGVFVDTALDEGNENGLPVIGTLGADFFRQNIVALDLRQNRFVLAASLKNLGLTSMSIARMTFATKNHLNRMVVTMKAGRSKFKVFYDSGSSAFNAVLLPGPWTSVTGRNRNDPGSVTVSIASWGKTVSMAGARSSHRLCIGSIPLGRAVVYREAKSLRAVVAPYDGLFGNAAFVGRGVVVIDVPDSLFGFEKTVP